MDILGFVKQNKTYNFMLNGAIKKIEQNLLQNEKVLYALAGNSTISNNNDNLKIDPFKIKGKLAGVLAITDNRIIFCNNSIGVSNFKEIFLKDIQSIDSTESSILGIGKLRIKGRTETFTIDISRKNIIEDVKEIIYKYKDNHKNESNIQKYSFSNADEILKYKQLLEQGIITQEEFEKKKHELL